MNTAAPGSDSACIAGRILDALERNNLEGLEAELGRRFTVPPYALPIEGERWELLEAIVRQMRAVLARIRRGSLAHFEGIEVQLLLLRHLAARDGAALT